MSRLISLFMVVLILAPTLTAQTAPSYSKDIRPFLTKYCLECHNAKTAKASLSLETHAAMMEGSDGGPVVVAKKPEASRLVLLIEHKDKPVMPPPKAKFPPTKDEVKLLRAWILAGAIDDGANVKVVLPAITTKKNGLPPVNGVAYLPKKKLVLIAAGTQLRRIDMIKATITEWTAAFHPITAVAVTPSENVFVGQSSGNAVLAESMWWSKIVHTDSVLDLAVDSNSRRMASGSYDSKIIVHDLKLGGAAPFELKEHSDAVYGLAFSPDGKLLASVSADRAMKVWDVEKGKLLYTLGEATDWLYTVAWSPNGKFLASGGVDKSIRVYEPTATGAKLRQSVFAHEGPVQKILFSSDSKTLYSVGQDRVIKAWDAEKMVERKVYDKQPETVLCMALREDASQIIIGRYDGIVQLIDMKTGKVAHEFGKAIEEGEKGRRGEREENVSARSSAQDLQVSLQGQKLPLQFAGTLDRAGAVNLHRFDAKANQSLAVQLTMDAKAKLEPVLTITDASGRVVAQSYDGHLGHTFSEGGACTVSVRDREFRGGAGFSYQLKLGEFPVLTAFFPMGVKRGSSTAIQLTGVFLPSKTAAITVLKDAKPGDRIPLPLGADVLGKGEVVVGDLPEVLSVGKMPVPGTANGRLQKDNQRDDWTFAARKGQRLVVEVNARRIGSRLDSVIEIVDKNDQPVPRAVLRSQAKTHVTFRDHDSAQGNIRIEEWRELGSNDYLFVGQELMKIQALPTHPDADCNFFATQGQRIGYLDTTPTHHANNTPMYKVTVHPPGTVFPPNGYPVFTLFYRNDDGGPGFSRDSRILFDPPADGEYKVRITDARGMGGVNFGYRLTVRHPQEYFRLKTTPANPVVSRGSAIPITITAERIDGFDGPIKVEVKNLPAGLHMPTTTIEAGTFATTVALYADASAKLPEKTQAALLEGTTFATGLPFASLSPFELPKLIDPGDIVTTVKESEVSIKPGEQAKMTVTIERKNGFKGRVPLDVKGLPHGVRVLDIGLNGILVNENESTRTVAIYAEPWVPAQDHPFVVLARREGKNSEHAAKAVVLKVK